MIAKMNKYSILLLNCDKEEAVSGIQDLGLMDIRRSARPVDKQSEAMLERIALSKKTIESLDRINWSKDPDCDKISKAAKRIRRDADSDILKEYEVLSGKLSNLRSSYDASLRQTESLKCWGKFSGEDLKDLAEQGIQLHFFALPRKKFDPQWAEQWPLTVIDDADIVRFVVVGDNDIPAQELPQLKYDYRTSEAESASLAGELLDCKAGLEALKAAKPELEKAYSDEINGLNLYLANASGEAAVDGMISVMTAFAPVEDDARICQALDGMNLYYVKEAATKEDNPPIKLRNNWFARNFETLTGMYGMPVYDEFDPTPILAPFFLLFWAFCMGDAGYGILLTIVGLLLPKYNILDLKNHWRLVTTLGIGTTVIGFFLGTFFGVNLTTLSWMPEALKNMMLVGKVNVGGSAYDIAMVAAIAIGVFHICLAMVIKSIGTTRRFGFKEAISTWGWTILIIGGLLVAAGALTSVLSASATKICIIIVGILSALGIFIFNKPGRNPLINIGAGLWDSYQMATGILGDVLSYIRLYALGLAGGMLGSAFNDLAAMTLGSDPTWQWIPWVVIILIGHALNFAMSCLGAFVHPLRLTFVEYFKNSGYEGKGVQFNPLKKETTK